MASCSASSSRPRRLVCPDKAVKSLHAVFAREGRADEPVSYEAIRHHEGRSFATLTITARQHSRGVLATSSICMHAVEDGPEHQDVADVPPVLGPSTGSHSTSFPGRPARPSTSTPPPPARRSSNSGCAHRKSIPSWRPALAAYATDLTLIGTALRPMDGLGQRGNGTQFTSAVTSHTLWFHRPFRTDDWLLLRQHSPLLAHGRCFGRGDVLTEGGVLVASYAQEALLRVAPEPAGNHEKHVLLSGEYKSQKMIVPLTPTRALVPEFVRQLPSICLMQPWSLRKATP